MQNFIMFFGCLSLEFEMENEYLFIAVKIIKTAILQSQYRAAKEVNCEQLSLYFGIGRYISENSRHGFWGTGAIEKISEQLHKELPGLRGFSAANIKFMRQFYEEWSRDLESLTAVSEIQSDKSLTTVSEIDTLQLVKCREAQSKNFDLELFLSLGFTHHMIIIRKAKTLSERIFYIRQAVANKWNKDELTAQINADLFNQIGSLPNNFAKTIPKAVSAVRALEMFKDEYLLDFINVEEIGERDKEDIDEREVEKTIIHNVKNFIMTFGHDFTFVGNQYHLEKFGHAAYPDLLFYNRELAALVAVELKRGEFKPAYLGQLSAYLRILDNEVKKPFENPSIGIVLCKKADKNFVEFLIQGYDNPMGVATYKTAEDVRKVLPSEDDLIRVMDEK